MILDKKYTGRDGLTTEERFFSHIIKLSNGCWEWNLSKKHRYGKFKFQNKNYSSHKFSYFLETGYMPSAKECVCHSCDNTYCVNPKHLFLGTQQDNMDDMVFKGRSPNNKGQRNPNSKLNEEIVREIRQRHAVGEKPKAISGFLNIPKSTINKIINHDTWASVV